jgi:UDP-glucose 4-epimerase
MESVDGCFHLAAIASVQRSIEDWVGTHRTNLTGTITVLDAARARNGSPARPVVFASSAAVYGASNELPLAETSTTRPVSAYGADKLGSELHAEVAASVFNVPATGLRFFNVYGPRQDPESPYSGVVSIFSNRLRAGLPITIFGDGGQTRDFIFVDDVVRFLRGAMETSVPTLRIFNVCTGRATSLLDLVATLAEIVARTPRILHEKPRSADIRHSLGDPAVARLSLGVAVQTTLRDGLRATLGLSGEPRQGLSESQLGARRSPA